jgi:hypothetical protein
MAEFSGVSSQALKSLQYTPSPSETGKGLVQPGSTGATQDPALIQWFEQANAYYNAVMAGDPSTPKPTEMEWNDFMAQLQWAQQTLGYGMAQGGPLGGVGGPGAFGAPQGPETNQFGGRLGPMGSYAYTDATAKIGFTGNGTHDIWSNDITIDVAPVSGHVTVSQVNDTRSNPAESVVKVVVTDPATGTEATYFIHDFDPAKDKLKINTPEEGQITSDSTGYAVWGEFKPGGASDPSAKPDASIEGEEISENTFRYEPEFAGETVNFWANPSEAGITQTHVVYADANISVKPSDEVNVEGPDAAGMVTITVNHNGGPPDGSADVYQVQKGYNANINQKIEYISEGGTPIGEDGIDGADLKSRITINGATGETEAEGAINPDTMVADLLEKTGRTEPQLLSALESAGFDFDTIEELKEAMGEDPPSFPPTPVTSEFLNFLTVLDEELNSSLDDYKTAMNECKPEDYEKAVEDMNERLVELLGPLYPNLIVDGKTPSGTTGAFSITGEDYTWTTDGEGITVNIE